MAISPITPNISSQIGSTQNNPPISSAGIRGEKEKDGDKDEGASSKVSAIAPTVNTSGQTIGTTISVSA